MSSELRHLVAKGDLAETFAALGDRRRLTIVQRLYATDVLSITSLSEGMAISRQAVTKHLNVLAAANIVSTRQSGRETLFSLEKQQIEEAETFLHLIGQKWDDALARLQSHLER